jgi:hypothetical protein
VRLTQRHSARCCLTRLRCSRPAVLKWHAHPHGADHAGTWLEQEQRQLQASMVVPWQPSQRGRRGLVASHFGCSSRSSSRVG